MTLETTYNQPLGYTHGKHWTQQDKETLREQYPNWKVSVEEMAEIFGRTQASVRGMARYLGLKRPVPDVEGLT